MFTTQVQKVQNQEWIQKIIQPEEASWAEFLYSDLPITEKIIKKAMNYSTCAIGEHFNLKPCDDYDGIPDQYK